MNRQREVAGAGRMQPWSMTVDRFIDHAARWHADREIVSFRDDEKVERTSYAALRADASRLSHALLTDGIVPGDRVATLAMNGRGHLAAWYGIAGIGAVCHTLNPRMSEDQLAWIVDHAQDRLLFADGAFAQTALGLARRCPSLARIVWLSPPHGVEESAGPSIEVYSQGQPADCRWGAFDEELAAGLCYTSGTTGNPKGVLYSHRSNVLHTLITVQPDAFGLSALDTIMPIVPMYHANAWGLAFAAPAVGAKLVLPGARLDGRTLYDRMRREGVTFAAAVPTAWLGLLDYMESGGGALPDLRRIVVGGAAMTEQLLRRFDALGIEAIAAWGMTELSPVGGVSTATPAVAAMAADERISFRLKQGRVPFGVDMRIADEADRELPRDGRAPGALQMRGPAVAAGYFRLDESPLTADGFLRTGDIATIDPQGYVKITDRAKDIIKSGGEWISSLEIETLASLCPGVATATVIGVPHPRWDERPLLLLVARPGAAIDIEGVRDELTRKLPKWWVPDSIETIDELPLGSTGKVDKAALRNQRSSKGEA